MPYGDPEPGTSNCPEGYEWESPTGRCRPKCPQGQSWNGSTCVSRSGSPSGDPTAPCPPGETREASSALCLCPGSQCRDIGSKQCRDPRGNEKTNFTDDIERDTGGGRGYCRPVDPGSSGGGAGGGGGVGGPSTGAPSVSPYAGMFDAQNKDIWDTLRPILKGKQTRYSPEVMARLDAQGKVASRGEARAGVDAVISNSISRGMGRSGIASRGIENVQRQAVQTYSDIANKNQIEKVRADFEDKMTALKMAEEHLSRLQSFVVALDTNQASREASMATIALGYARIQAEMAMLQKRLAADMEIAQGGWDTSLELQRRQVPLDLFR
jgi:hypothetical protein